MATPADRVARARDDLREIEISLESGDTERAELATRLALYELATLAGELSNR